jgi:hypothetical protein
MKMGAVCTSEINFRHCENVNSCKWVNKIRSSDEFWNTLYRTWSIKTKKKVYFASSYVYHACRSPTWGTRWRSWLRHCAASREVAIPN